MAEPLATCRVCGCTDDRACVGGCWWVIDPVVPYGALCSTCLPAELARGAVAGHGGLPA
jgi:hypothetical protein